MSAKLYRNVRRCSQCGGIEITETYTGNGHPIVTCWRCGHRVVGGQTTAGLCPKCGNPAANEFYDKEKGVVLECSPCGAYLCSGMEVLADSTLIKCTQCGSPDAVEFFEELKLSVEIWCWECGHAEYRGPIWDYDNDFPGEGAGWNREIRFGAGGKTGIDQEPHGWKREMKFGAGFMQCRVKGGGFYLLPLHSPDEVGRAEKLLREKLLSGELEEIDTRLTRWNREKKQVERVLGKGSKRPW